MERGLFERFLLKGYAYLLCLRVGWVLVPGVKPERMQFLFFADERLNGMADLKLTGERRITLFM